MLNGPIALLLLLAGGPAADPADPVPARGFYVPQIGMQVDPLTRSLLQVIIKERVIIRVPSRSAVHGFAPSARVAPAPPAPMVMWRETRAPRCIAMRTIVGVQAARKDSIDILTRESQRLRAQLKRGCRALDFYSGFYMQASGDGKLCEDRDMLQSRSGAQCEIEKFRLMVPVEPER